MTDLPDLGVGLMYLPGLEPVLDALVHHGSDILDVIEVEPQPVSRVCDGGLRLRPEPAEYLAALPQAKLVHSVGAPVAGSVHAVDMLAPAAEAVRALEAPWASEHLNFDRVPAGEDSHFAGFMLPALQSRRSVDLAVHNIAAAQARLGVPVAVETPVNYVRPFPGEMSDGAFYRAVADQADCGLLVDVHNLWCNERNGRQPVLDVLAELPAERVWEVHLAGGRELDGYWVDAHSGLVEEPVWRLAEQVVCRLPNLKAIVFEAMPDYLAAGDIGAEAVAGQLRRMRELWVRRGSGPPLPRRRRRLGSGGAPTSADEGLPDPVAWEAALGACVAGRPSGDRLSRRLTEDPGVAVYQKMISSVRVGVLVDALRLTYRLLALTLGDDGTRDLLHRYIAEVPGHPVAHEEVRRFREWLTARGPDVGHAVEVADFELALVDVHTEGRARTVRFTVPPLPLLVALGAGRLPEPAAAGDYLFEVTP